MSQRRPVIGVTGYHVMEEEGYGGRLRGNIGQGFSVFGNDYLQCVERVGGIPVGLPLTDGDFIEDMLAPLDAVVVTGGEDVDPRLYGENVDHRFGRLTPQRDEFELQLLDMCIHLNKPVLAICRGLHVVNVYFGGTLYKDVSDKGSTLTHNFENNPRWYRAHTAKLTHALLKQMYEADEIEINSYHHQAAAKMGQGLVVAAEAPDGIVEALVHERRPVLAVQWHPEMMADRYEAGLLPFDWLIKAAGSESS